MSRFFDFLVSGSKPGLLTLAAMFLFVALLCVVALVLVYRRMDESCGCPQSKLESQARDSYLLKTFHSKGCRRRAT